MLVAGLGERGEDLDVGVDARRDPAEQLHQAVLAEGDRGVALLAGEERRPGLEVELRLAHLVELELLAACRRRRTPCSHNGVAAWSCSAS